jgi:Protein of unknown function (DUF1449)
LTLLDASLQFPTVVFTIGLGIALFYWVFVLIGALDIDLLGGGDVSGAAKGIGDIMGAGKGGGEMVKLGGDGDGHGDGDGGFLKLIGLSSVPITISLSVILLAGWCGSLLVMNYGAESLSAFGRWLPLVVLPTVLVVAVIFTSFAVRPLGKVFEVTQGKFNRDYVGHSCTLTTGRVDAGFGQATIEDGGDVLVISVRCDQDNKLARGDRVLVIDFDTAREAYVVEPIAEVLAASDSKSGDGAST